MSEPTFDEPLDEGAFASDFDEPTASEQDKAEAAIPAEEPAVEPNRDAPSRDPARPKKPGFDTYTAMLALSLVATITACVFLALELRRYDWEVQVPATPPVTQSP